ncbi:hypothetical protein MRB53_038385 [Persea americana]|nr:hypothetical protein MRB53_038385 [Persea americana]
MPDGNGSGVLDLEVQNRRRVPQLGLLGLDQLDLWISTQMMMRVRIAEAAHGLQWPRMLTSEEDIEALQTLVTVSMRFQSILAVFSILLGVGLAAYDADPRRRHFSVERLCVSTIYYPLFNGGSILMFTYQNLERTLWQRKLPRYRQNRGQREL